jgi:hypothetical protein
MSGSARCRSQRRSPPKNQHQESDTHDLISYLVSRYPGTHFLEYQRFDTNFDRDGIRGARQIFPGSPSTATTNSSSHSSERVLRRPGSTIGSMTREFTPSKTRLVNGTALLMAARDANLPAVKVLVEAGADVSAPLGHYKASALSGRTSSSYATKEGGGARGVILCYYIRGS